MVLDISGSMSSNSRIQNLRNAGKVFVDTVIRPESTDLISLSLVPYSEHVNIGPDLYGELNTNTVHDYSHCVEMPDSAFDSVALNTASTFDQVQHFQWIGSSNDRTRTVCPRYDFERIRPISQNATQLKSQIDDLQPRSYTSIFLGMKWGAALLDPSMRTITTNLISAGKIDAAFSGRPADYSDTETLKTIILMTDGENTESKRISSFVYANENHRTHWDRYNFTYYINRYVSSSSRGNWWSWKYRDWQGDALLDNICDATKAAGIIVWTIGLEVTNHGADVMRQCASSPSHYFRVEGIELSEAFRAIARQINQLRLIQ
jgi:hypothetical protein